MRPLQWFLNTDRYDRPDSKQFSYLFGLMFVWLLLLAAGDHLPLEGRFMGAAFAVIAVQALLITARSGRERVAFVLFGVFLFVKQLLPLPGVVNAVTTGVLVLFLLFIPLRLSVYVLDQDRVDANIVFGALCAYLFLGLCWAGVYEAIVRVHPEAIYVPTSREPDFVTWTYFSFTTLSTLGYGDIVPRNYAARMLAIVEALVGQIYLVVVVARLVGNALAKSEEKE